MTISHWQSSRKNVAKKADVVVVGAGITGASTAFWLRRLSPTLKVVVVDQDGPAAGASGRNAGFLLQGHATSFVRDVERLGPERAALFWHFTLENRDLVFSEFEGRDVGLSATGSVTAAGSHEESEMLRQSAELLSSMDQNVSFLDVGETARATASTGFCGGLYVPTGAVVNPVRLVDAIVESSGAEVCTGVRVKSIAPIESGCRVVCDGMFVEARHAVVAVNSGTGLLLPEEAPAVRPVRAQMMITQSLPHHLSVPVYSHEGYYYVRQLGTGEVLVGGARHLHREAETGHEDATTLGLQEDLSRYLRAHFPWSVDHVAQARWSGTMAFTDNMLPRVGRIAGVQSGFWVGGFSGHGMSMAFLTGKVVAGLVLDLDRHPILDLIESES